MLGGAADVAFFGPIFTQSASPRGDRARLARRNESYVRLHFGRMRTQEIVSVVQAALECSIYRAPTEPGLTWDEIIQCVRHLGYDDGEIADALRTLSQQREGKRYMPTYHQVMGFFYESTEPDFRNLDAIDFIFRQMRDIARKEGIARANWPAPSWSSALSRQGFREPKRKPRSR